MKILLIGGTGTISTAISRRIIANGDALYLLNRGNRTQELEKDLPGVKQIICNARDEDALKEATKGMEFDVVGEFIGFVPEDVQRDYRVFKGRVGQYIYISSAAAYCKPPLGYVITEKTPLVNPYWQYARNKIYSENFLFERFREDGFPVTVVRPSHTYDERTLPLGPEGSRGCWVTLKRMLEGKEVLVHGDGTSLWTITHNSDFAVGYCALLGNPKAIGEAFQITSDEALSWNDIYKTVGEALGVQPKLFHVSSEFLAQTSQYDFLGSLIGDKCNSAIFDNSKLKALCPEMRTNTPFRVGAKMTVDNLLAHPALRREDPDFEAFCDRVIAIQREAMGRL